MTGAGEGGQAAACALAAAPPTAARLPWGGLLALASAGFITILTEALPAGLLSPMSADLGVSRALVGQLVTVYALGSLLAALPMTALTQRLPRRPLLLAAIAGFVVVNTVTALTHAYPVMLVARFIAGISAGLLWSLVAGYASRMVAPHLQGRAIAVAMVGTPLALSLGIPAGTLLGQTIGWRWAFGLMSLLSVGLLLWARLVLPALAAPGAGARQTLGRVWRLPGMRAALLTMFLFVLAHNVLYTYIEPFAALAGAVGWLDRLLLVFGVAALLGIWITGVWVDRWLHRLVIASTAGFALAALALAVWPGSALVLVLGTLAWGVAFGGVATQFQTAVARRAGAAGDIAQSFVVTGWNLAIALGGVVGGVMLETLGERWLPGVLLVLLAATLVVVMRRPAAWAAAAN
ncbi:MFS transporter [Stenotrophomonas rhizophila]|uniref:MFS transporter n=1 Tax=Stenotrophomonas rhizophila TaxID=216778 RepID=UPI001E64A9FB|nr:MFS transporter [Stenotrophomonas rhizophila]MCC7634170.1 MFS transporter [Stenotrophomonas rhizophila]MCC7662866.1 MFS transporter [Stenotrophomonas rhizophila]